MPMASADLQNLIAERNRLAAELAALHAPTDETVNRYGDRLAELDRRIFGFAPANAADHSLQLRHAAEWLAPTVQDGGRSLEERAWAGLVAGAEHLAAQAA